MRTKPINSISWMLLWFDFAFYLLYKNRVDSNWRYNVKIVDTREKAKLLSPKWICDSIVDIANCLVGQRSVATVMIVMPSLCPCFICVLRSILYNMQSTECVGHLRKFNICVVTTDYVFAHTLTAHTHTDGLVNKPYLHKRQQMHSFTSSRKCYSLAKMQSFSL